MLRLDGSLVAQARQKKLQSRIDVFVQERGRQPGLAVLIVGNDPASQVYVRNKVKKTESLGMRSFHFELPETISEVELLEIISNLNQDPDVDGILVQLPLPRGLNAQKVLDAIHPEKDPDGLTVGNLGLLMAGRERIAPCTPSGVMAILDHYGLPVEGRHAVVIGRSHIVGKPMAQLLLKSNATVTICHSKTRELIRHTKAADIVVVAAGQPRFLGREAFGEDAVVIDVGIHRPSSGEYANRLCGDVRYEELGGLVRAATPVPKGVGPMTIQMLMENTVRLAELRV